MARSAFSLALLSPGPAVSPLSTRTLLHYNPPGGGRRQEMSKRCKFEAGKGKRKRFRSFFSCFLHFREEHGTRNGRRQWACRWETRACVLWIGLFQISGRNMRKRQLFMTNKDFWCVLLFKNIYLRDRESALFRNYALIPINVRISVGANYLQSYMREFLPIILSI